MQKIFLVLFGIVCILTGCTSTKAETEPVMNKMISDEGAESYSDDSTGEESIGSSEEISSQVLVVYVCGAVSEPGVYELSFGSRINDAVIAAGGFSDEADTTYVNLAAEISDGAKLRIPTLEETEEIKGKGNVLSEDFNSFDKTGHDVDVKSVNCELININSATEEELKTLPGIGDSIAARIVKYRQQNGKFNSIEDIMEISGIKDKLFSKIKEYITV
ncbi:helix-hairpin-helix domain-containing protein [Butyrivibrio sp. AE2005]|uniref:helix-hairpin-helix domain-containing protein n=1 Tax=Butyrivibrio sp. AE2005 TaxID=1496722 RepID=UPI00047B37FC|nr:helix-hairpin-helix domain-containing protein [Butyrivibrio sp. AE2005]